MPILPLDQIIHGDCIEVMRRLPDQSVDLIFADPPYNLQLRGGLWRPDNSQVNAVNDDWDDFGSFADYDQFTRVWLSEARRLLKPTSSIWVCGTYHNIYRVGTMMQNLGYWMLNGIAWYKRDATPNFNGMRLKNDVEHLIWAKRDEKAKYTFNHHLMKQFNDDKQHGSMWDIPKVKRYEQLLDDNNDRVHNTQKPEALLQRVILSSTHPDDIVFDPFFGSGTTGAVAKRLRRRWFGVELDEAYIATAQQRIAAIDPLPANHAWVQKQPDPKDNRVPFTKLLEAGYVRAGQTLYLVGTDKTATILANGRLQAGDRVETIHIMCRYLLDVPSCNGWTVWEFEDKFGKRYPLDALRQRYRQNHR